MPNIEGNVSSANLNGNISTSSNISGNIYPRGEQGKSGTIKVGEVKTVEYNQGAKVTNVGDENNAIFNFEIPKGKTSEVENVDWGKITGNIDNQNDLKQMINNKLTPYIKKDENNDINLEGNVNVTSSKNTQSIFSVKRSDTKTQILLGVDSDGIKHGIYSSKLNKWIVEADEEDANFNGKWNGLVNDINTNNTTDDLVPVISNGKIQHRVISTDLNGRGIFGMSDTSRHLDFDNVDRRKHLLPAESLVWWDGSYKPGGYSNLEYSKYGKILVRPKVVFYNANGDNSDTINFSENIKDAKRIDIYFKDASNNWLSTSMINPNGRDVMLQAVSCSGGRNSMKYSSAVYRINENKMFIVDKGVSYSTGGYWKNNELYVYEIDVWNKYYLEQED